ncbi:adaptor protein MecA [Apilactobacillus apisilvae]|uniref:Adaptor protein MecA n=1 Tax=Apilactobacillus apisilvae TaxID=2923364 RepID=A0ABY4PJ84_9LACO|nr:adaptor protein MecA [Apilactobacillus apisilvae]UQS85560.1 adaptor protein MecA [Apilactobacillus apisilvae]
MEMQRINEDTIKVIISNDELSERGVDVLSLLGDEDRIESFLYGILEEIDADKEFKDTSAVTFQVVPNKSGLEMFIKNNHLSDQDIDKNKLSNDNFNKTTNNKNNGYNNSEHEDLENLSFELNKHINNFNQEIKDQNGRDNLLYNLKKIKNEIDGLMGSKQNDMINKSISQLVNAAKSMDNENPNTLVTNITLKFNSFEDLIGLSKALENKMPETYLYKYNDDYYLYMTLPDGYNNDDKVIFQRDVSLSLEYASKSRIPIATLSDDGKLMIKVNALPTLKKYFAK